MLKPEVLVIAPLDVEERVQDAIRRAVEESGFSVVHYHDAIRPGAELTSSILESIRRTDVIIADVSRRNPNVFYEVGFAHALRKPTVLLLNHNSEKVPSVLAGLQYIVYDVSNIDDLADRLKSEITALAMYRSA